MITLDTLIYWIVFACHLPCIFTWLNDIIMIYIIILFPDNLPGMIFVLLTSTWVVWTQTMVTWDIRCIYIWGFSCLDYFFDILNWWICNMRLRNLFCPHLLYLMLYQCWCVSVLTTQFFNTCLSDSDLSIHVYLFMHVTWHSSYHSLGSFLTPLDLYV